MSTAAQPEYLGYFHNQGLNIIANSPGFPSLTSNDVYEIAVENAVKIFPGEATLTTADLQTLLSYLNSGDNLTTIVQHLINDYTVPTVLQPYFYSIVNTLDSSYDFFKVILAFNELENEILADGELTVDQKNNLLACTVIARHSIWYWTDQWNNPSSPWYISKLASIGQNGGGIDFFSKKKPCGTGLGLFLCFDTIAVIIAIVVTGGGAGLGSVIYVSAVVSSFLGASHS